MLDELISNVLKHSMAKNVEISLSRKKGYFSVSVSDNGKGADIDPAADKGTYGLKKIKERLEKLKGSFSMETAAGKGTKVVLLFPEHQESAGNG